MRSRIYAIHLSTSGPPYMPSRRHGGAAASLSIIFRLASKIISSRLRFSVSCLLSFVAVQSRALLGLCSSFCFPFSSDAIRDCRLYRVIRSGSSFLEPESRDCTVDDADCATEGCGEAMGGWKEGGAC